MHTVPGKTGKFLEVGVLGVAGSDGMDTEAVSQLDTAQAELEAGNALLLQGAPFLVEMLALQAAAPGMHPVSFLHCLEACFAEHGLRRPWQAMEPVWRCAC